VKPPRAFAAALLSAFAGWFATGTICALACAGSAPRPPVASADSHCGNHSPARREPAGDRCEHGYRLEGRISPVVSFPLVLEPVELAPALSRRPVGCGPAEVNPLFLFESPPLHAGAASVLRL
jgi:hypothetical protein